LIPLAVKGTVILGVPIGTNDFVNDAIGKEPADCDQQRKKLVHFPFANCFLLLTRYCANRKLIYLARNVSPMTMLPHAKSFDYMIDKMIENYLTLPLITPTRLVDIAPGSRLDLQQIIQLARFQLRDS
jgi:hypothetical protein